MTILSVLGTASMMKSSLCVHWKQQTIMQRCKGYCRTRRFSPSATSQTSVSSQLRSTTTYEPFYPSRFGSGSKQSTVSRLPRRLPTMKLGKRLPCRCTFQICQTAWTAVATACRKTGEPSASMPSGPSCLFDPARPLFLGGFLTAANYM